MLKKHLDVFKLGLLGAIVCFIGIIILLYNEWVIRYGGTWLGWIFILMGSLSYLKHHNLKMAFWEVVMGLILVFYPDLPMFILSLSTSIVFLLHALAHLVTTVLNYRDKSWDFFKEGFLTVYYTVLSVCALGSVRSIFVLTGFYLILYGISDMREALFTHLKLKTPLKYRHKVHIQLPVLLSVLIPSRVLEEIGHTSERSVFKKDHYDLEVLIHMTPSGYSALGHVDICINGYVITYGNYDASTYRLFDAIGQGVLMVVEKEKYVPFCKKDTNKTLIGFGMKLTDAQKVAVRKRIKSIFDLLYTWECDYKKYEKVNNKEGMAQSLKYYANRIYKDTNARMYKFKKSKFKSYFVITTNCVLLADSILGKAGVDLLGINGIITPGTYYDYLNREFQKQDSNVVSRSVYS